MSELCLIYHLGLMTYRDAWQLQENLAKEIGLGNRPPALLLLEHPHVFSFGRSGDPTNLLWSEAELSHRQVDLVWADRGGDVTYHGPGQLVGYPLLRLAPGGLGRGAHAGNGPSNPVLPKADYIGYLRNLERTLILALARFGVDGIQIPGKTGVWIQKGIETPEGQPAKIAAIGVKVDARGVSRHGFALNVAPDMSYWEGIIGCGLTGYPAISLAQLIDPAPSMQEVEQAVILAFQQIFGYEMVEAPGNDLPTMGKGH